MIVPVETPLTKPYWDAARRGEVLLQHCAGCGQTWHPPAPVCPGCRSTSWSWSAAAGTGTLYSWTRVVHPVHAQVAQTVPYLVALVRLTEGPLFVCGLTATRDDAHFAADSPVRIGLGTSAGGQRLPMARFA